MQRNTGLLLEKLILVGHRKNYIVPFHPGVNIIYGDADTGKSSILRMVYYLLGGKKIQVDNEISSSVTNIVLELKINNSPYCIRRDLFDPSRMIEIFECGYEKIKDNFPAKYAPTLGHHSKKKSISEFLLDQLGFPGIEIKQSPSKDNSEVARLSVLDLFKYCYLDQDEVGSSNMLDIGNFVIETKNREIFKYIFNVLDAQISNLNVQIAEKTAEKNVLEEKLEIISEFLSETEFDSLDAIEAEIAGLDDKKLVLDAGLEKINSQIIGSEELYNQFKDALNIVYSEISQGEMRKSVAMENLERFGRLRNDYLNDIDKLKAIEAASDLIGTATQKKVSCPICSSTVDLSEISNHFSITSDDKVRHEVRSLSRRVRDLEQILDSNRATITQEDELLAPLYKERLTATRFLDEKTSKSITPYLSQRDAIIYENASLVERREKYIHELKVRNQQAIFAERISKLVGNITLLKVKLAALEKSAPSIDAIFTRLGGELNKYLTFVNIKNRTGVAISSKSYLPVVRDIEYRNINSGGLRTIVSIGYLAILQAYSIENEINLPNLLMIDTVGKFLGKTKEIYQNSTDSADDEAEGISDPEKYKKVYEYLIDLSAKHEEKGRACQILLVDNDVPADISSKYKGFVIAHYSSDGANGLPIGLIDDWDAHLANQGKKQ